MIFLPAEHGPWNPPSRSRYTLVLGAGFSRAIASQIPLTDELGDYILSKLPQISHAPHSFESGLFEVWLSRLALDQPDLTESANLYNRSLFYRITELIVEIISERERSFRATVKPPGYLLTLMGLAHAGLMNIISFNYDTLIEHAVAAHQLQDWKRGPVTPTDIVSALPPPAPRPGIRKETFRLLKLHGSTNTYWVPGDLSGATVYRDWETTGSWGDVGSDEYDPRPQGLEPLVVPPAAAKSDFYRSTLIRGEWQQAAESLRTATTIALLGYSLPLTDTVTLGMFGEYMRNTGSSTTCDVVVVNTPRGAPEVEARLLGIGVNADRIQRVTHGNPIETFVDDLEGKLCRSLTRELQEAEADGNAVVVGWSREAVGVVTGIQSRGKRLELEIEKIQPLNDLYQTLGGSERLATVGDVKSSLSHGGVDEVVAVVGDRRMRIVSSGEPLNSFGGAVLNWTWMIPASLP